MGEEKLNIESFFNASLDYQVVSWTGHKTGSTTMVNILNELRFKFYKFNGKDFEVLNNRPQRIHGCYSDSIPYGFKVLSSLRNPFSQIVSEYRYGPLENFNSFVIKILSQRKSLGCFFFEERKPDYIVRLENMFEDYSKIPFVIESNFFKSGILKKFTQYRMNEHPEGKTNWKDYYNEEIAEMVIQTFPYHFSDWLYDKNSWK